MKIRIHPARTYRIRLMSIRMHASWVYTGINIVVLVGRCSRVGGLLGDLVGDAASGILLSGVDGHFSSSEIPRVVESE